MITRDSLTEMYLKVRESTDRLTTVYHLRVIYKRLTMWKFEVPSYLDMGCYHSQNVLLKYWGSQTLSIHLDFYKYSSQHHRSGDFVN